MMRSIRSPVSHRTFAPHSRRVAAGALIAIAMVVVLAAQPVGGVSAQIDTGNVISGRVVNETSGGTVPPGLNVILLTLDEEAGQIIEQDSTIVGTNGEFSFDDLLQAPGYTYRVVADNGDHTPSIDLAPGDTFTGVEIPIYDSTDSLDDIRISSYAMLVPSVDGRSRTMGVLTVANLINSGDRVWLPDLENENLTGLDLLRFNLPEGFSDLSGDVDRFFE